MVTFDATTEVVLRRSRWDRDELTEVTARFRSDGALEIEYYTAGASVLADIGDSDYEHFTVVAPRHLDRMVEALMAELVQLPLMAPASQQRTLLTLLEHRFASDPIPSSSIERWLAQNGIPYTTATM